MIKAVLEIKMAPTASALLIYSIDEGPAGHSESSEEKPVVFKQKIWYISQLLSSQLVFK